MGTKTAPTPVNNAFYDTLDTRWYDADDDPVALLRAEGRLKNAWIQAEINRVLGDAPCRILDVGCGAGFLCNPLAEAGHHVEGVDLSPRSLQIATERDSTGRAHYQVADAYELPFPPEEFDVVCSMDFLEHVEFPEKVVAEAARVLRPGGLFFFHTFNRNPLAWLIIIKGVEWFVRNTPRNMHVLRLFIKPSELTAFCRDAGMKVEGLRGLRPMFGKPAFWKMLCTRRVPPDFEFVFTPSLLLSYLGTAVKPKNPSSTSLLGHE